MRRSSPNRFRRRDGWDAARRFAERRHCVVDREQLVGFGIEPRAIDRRVEARILRRLFRGVYLFGLEPPPLAIEYAAVLACAPHAYLSNVSASRVWELTPRLARPKRPEVILVGRDVRPSGIRVRRTLELLPAEITRLKHIPITTPARTLLDLAAVLEPRKLEQALAEAFRRRLVRRQALLTLLARRSSRPGAAKLSHLLEGEPAFARTELEERFLALVRDAGLPEPEMNAELGPYEIDALWREHRLAVELDSWQWHSDRKAFEDDRRRDTHLVAWGYRVIRITWRQLLDEPLAVAARLAAALDT